MKWIFLNGSNVLYHSKLFLIKAELFVNHYTRRIYPLKLEEYKPTQAYSF